MKNIVNFCVYIDFYGGTHLNFAMTTFQVVFVDHFDNSQVKMTRTCIHINML